MLDSHQIASFPNMLVVDKWRTQNIEHGFLNRELDFPKDSAKFESLFTQRLLLLKQTHSTDFIEVNSERDFKSNLEADAWLVKVGALEKAVIGIKTADCVPILINTSDNSYRAAVHCGWRSAVGGLLTKVVERMIELGVAKESIEVAFGPSAGVCCYQVGEDVVVAVADAQSKLENRFLIEPLVKRGSNIYADIQSLLLMQLLSLGLSKDQTVNNSICTISSTDYFSYRREKDQAGRQLSFIEV